jgi:hypothetical protein
VPARARPEFWLGTTPARANVTLAAQISIPPPHSLARAHRTGAHGRHSPSLPRSLSFSWRLATKPVNPSPNPAARRPPPAASLAGSQLGRRRGLVASSSSVWPLLGYSVVVVASPVEEPPNRRSGASSLPPVIHVAASVWTRSFLPRLPPFPSSRASSLPPVVVVRSSHRQLS